MEWDGNPPDKGCISVSVLFIKRCPTPSRSFDGPATGSFSGLHPEPVVGQVKTEGRWVRYFVRRMKRNSPNDSHLGLRPRFLDAEWDESVGTDRS